MQIKVRFFTVLREITGSREQTVELPENEKMTVEQVLHILAEKHGSSFREYIYDKKTQEVRSFLQFFINGKSTSAFEGLKTELNNGDTLAIVPPVGGG